MPYRPPVSPVSAGFRHKCPACGQGDLYRGGYLKLAEACTRCGLDYSQADSGDGPAVFVIFIVGFAAISVTFLMRFALYAPLWAALGVGIGFAFGLIMLLIKPLKSAMIAIQYAKKASERASDGKGW